MATIVVRTPVGYLPTEGDSPSDGLVQSRRLRITAASFNNGGPFPSTATLNVGSALPASAIVLGSSVLVTAAFTLLSNPLLDLGYSGGTLTEIGDNAAYDLPAVGTYVTEDSSLPPASAQIVATLTTDATVLVGSADIVVRFIEL